MSKKEFQKVMGQVYSIGIQRGKTEDEMITLANDFKKNFLKENAPRIPTKPGVSGTPRLS